MASDEQRRDDAIVVTNNRNENRYEAVVDGALAVLIYARDGDHITYLHTEVPPELAGRGVGGALARTALEEARSDHLSITSDCPFVASYIRRHPAYLALIPEADRALSETSRDEQRE